jgi:hypothetical protein
MTEGAMGRTDQRLLYSELDQICGLVGNWWYRLLNRFDSRKMHDVFMLQYVQIGSGAHTVSYSLGVTGPFLQVKSGRSVSRPLSPI